MPQPQGFEASKEAPRALFKRQDHAAKMPMVWSFRVVRILVTQVAGASRQTHSCTLGEPIEKRETIFLRPLNLRPFDLRAGVSCGGAPGPAGGEVASGHAND